MIPSANSTENQAGNLCWHSGETWQDQGVIPTVYSGLEARYFQSSRQPDWDWENAMILAQQTANGCEGDQQGDYKTGVMQAEAIDGVSSLRQYEGLLSATVNPSTLSLSPNTWGLLSTVGVRDASSSGFQGSSNPSCSSLGATWIDGYEGNGSSLYGDSRSSLLGHVNFDHRRLEDIVKRELCSTGDFNSRIGLNLGGRTYFSAEDYGRFGKRSRPNSPGPQAPLCQAEGCKSDLRIAKHYHRRHKVCEYHSKAATVLIRGQTQRFCQQCSRFHFLSEFDDGKRSCRKRLADHNRRRRKPQHSPSAISSTTDQTIAQKKNGSEEAAASENNRNGSLSKSSLINTEQGLAIPRATSASALSREPSRQVSTLSERNGQKAINHSPLPGNCSAGPSLSLTSSGRVSHGVNGQKPSTGETYGRVDLSVKWLRPGNSGTKLVESDVTRSDCSPSAYMEKPNVSGRPDGSTLLKNVASLQTSRDPIESADCIMKSIAQRGSKQLEAFSSTNLRLDGKSDGQNVLRLLEQDNERDGQTTNKYSEDTVHPTLRFLEEPIQSTASVNRMSDKPIDCWEPSWCQVSISARPQAAKQIDLQQR